MLARSLIGPSQAMVLTLMAGLSLASYASVNVGQPAPDFTGRDALLRQRESGVDRRLILFRVGAGRILLTHDEPVYRDGQLVGRTTSGGIGFRTDMTLCLAMVSLHADLAVEDVFRASYEVEAAGERFPMSALRKPPYDPERSLLRG